MCDGALCIYYRWLALWVGQTSCVPCFSSCPFFRTAEHFRVSEIVETPPIQLLFHSVL